MSTTTELRSWWRRLGVVVLLACLVGLPARAAEPGLTPEQVAQVRDYFAKAKERRTAGDPQGAIDYLRRAIDIEAAPYLIYTLARVYEDTTQYELAESHYRLCVGNAVDEATRTRATDALMRVEQLLANGQLQITVKPVGATITIDDAVVTPDAKHIVLVAPGEHRVVVDQQGYASKHHRITAVAGKLTPLEVELQLADVRAPTKPAPDPIAPRPLAPEPGPDSGATAAWWLIGSGGVVAVTGVVLYVVGAGKHAEIEAAQADPAADGAVDAITRQEALALSKDGKLLKTIGVFGASVGIGVVAAGIIVLATSGPSAADARVQVVGGPAGAELGLGLATRF